MDKLVWKIAGNYYKEHGESEQVAFQFAKDNTKIDINIEALNRFNLFKSFGYQKNETEKIKNDIIEKMKKDIDKVNEITYEYFIETLRCSKYLG